MFQVKYFVFIICLASAESRLGAVDPDTDPQLGKANTNISQAKRKEIEDLRSELRKALDKDDEQQQQQAGKSIIVQPTWLQDTRPSRPLDSKVTVTYQDLMEVKALRDEINKAVQENTYVASVQKNTSTTTKNIKDFQAKYDSGPKDKVKLSGSFVSATHDDSLHSEKASDADLEEDQDVSKYKPNIVESSTSMHADLDLSKLHKLEISKRRTREMLLLKSIDEDFGFNFGADVLAWAYLIHKGHEYFIGRRLNDLLIVRRNATYYENSFPLEIGQPIVFVETFSFFNAEHQLQEGVILVGLKDRILWYHLDQETDFLKLFWEWNLGSELQAIRYMRIDSKDFLAVGMRGFEENALSFLNIYQFKIKEKMFWIAQHVPMKDRIAEISFLDTGRDFILAVPQNNSALIYSFNPNMLTLGNHLYFQFLRSIPSSDIEHIAAFQMGGQSYLALGGRQPQILLYQQGDFISKTILGQNFGLVELFFPIPVRTYRDDLILLIQHRVDFSTHSLIDLEALIWNGNVFETSIPVQCNLGGHREYGVACMMDLNREEGLKGSVLLRKGKELSLLVPRYKAESGLFHLTTELLPKNSQLLDLKEIFDFLKSWVQEQDELIHKAKQYLQQSEDMLKPVTNTSRRDLHVEELDFNGTIGEIFINDYLWTEQDSNTDLVFVVETIENLGLELRPSRSKRQTLVKDLEMFDSLDFDVVQVESLEVLNHNRQPFYLQDKTIEFDGILNLYELEVLEKVKGRVQREVTEEDVQMVQNIEFESINGVKWEELLSQMIWKNKEMSLYNMILEGEAIFESFLSVGILNELTFPEDFLRTNASGATAVITGGKIFTSSLTANEMDTDGRINGLSPFDAINLQFSQDWFGLPTFENLEITEKFELNGTSKGSGVRSVPLNPLLDETELIQAACNFEDLEIHGPLLIQNSFEDQIFKEPLNNLVQRPENPSELLIVKGLKTFFDLQLPVDFNLKSNQINKKPIEKFIPKHTSQVLDIKLLESFVFFQDLTVSGLYDSVNVSKLFTQSVKVNEPQWLPSTQMNFANPIQGTEMKILQKLNGIPVPDALQTLEEPLRLQQASFVKLEAKLVNSPLSVEGQALINHINLTNFLSKSNWKEVAPQGNIFVKNLELGGDLKTDELHGIDAQLVLDFLKEIDDLPEMILNGKVLVEKVIISGDTLVHFVNNQNFDEDIQMRAIWLNRPNFLNTNLVFKDPIKLHNNLSLIGELNGENFYDLLEDIVFRGEAAVIKAPKSFVNNLNIRENLKAQAINGLPCDFIANKQHDLYINSSLKIQGNVFLDSLNVKRKVNSYSCEDIGKKLNFSVEDQEFILLGWHSIDQKQHLRDLTIQGDMNHLLNLTEFFGSLVYKDGMCELTGNNTFMGRTTIRNGATIGRLNDYDLQSLLGNIVMRNEVKPVVIESPVNFMGKIHLKDLSVRGTLNVKQVKQCELNEWMENTMRVDQSIKITKPMHFGRWSLDNNPLKIDHLNGIDLSQLMTLNSLHQNGHEFNFSDVYLDGEINVKGLVNQIDLRKEYENTLLASGDQHIDLPLSLPSLKVLQSLEMLTPVNGDKHLNDLVRINEVNHLRTPLFFQTLVARNLQTNYELSGLQVGQWLDKCLLVENPYEQLIQGNWTIDKLIIDNQSPLPFGPFASQETNYQTFPRVPRAFDYPLKKCRKFKQHLAKPKTNQQLRIKSVEKSFSLRLNQTMEEIFWKVFILENGKENFLLLNTKCQSILYQWEIKAKEFVLVKIFESGPLKDVQLMFNAEKNSSSLHLIKDLKLKEEFKCKDEELSVNKRSLPDIVFENDNELTSNLSLSPEYSTHERVQRSRLQLKNKYSLPLFYKRVNTKTIQFRNASLESRSRTSKQWPSNTYTLEDYQSLLMNILKDINYRLDLEVNITQLSIPESDLYDEHFIGDFINVVQDLQSQHFYQSQAFSDFTMENLNVPGTPAQVLAARTVQIVWPFIVEIEEFHAQLSNPLHQKHQFCLDLSSKMGGLLSDMLRLMQLQQKSNSSSENFNDLLVIIERLRIFQKDLLHLAEKVEQDFLGSLDSPDIAKLDNYTFQPEHLSEVLSLKIGSNSSSHSVFVMPMLVNDPENGQLDVVNVYLPHYNDSLFQSIKAKKPKHFLGLHVGNETLLAFVEQKTSMRILIYRGIQGFVELSKFKVTQKPEILTIFKVRLPVEGQSKPQHFIGVVLRRSIQFYEIVKAKTAVPSSSTQEPIICL